MQLAWHASTSSVIGYNVYRSTTSGGPYAKINASLVTSLTYSDTAVVNSTTYYYVTTSVDSAGIESVNSTKPPPPFPDSRWRSEPRLRQHSFIVALQGKEILQTAAMRSNRRSLGRILRNSSSATHAGSRRLSWRSAAGLLTLFVVSTSGGGAGAVIRNCTRAAGYREPNCVGRFL